MIVIKSLHKSYGKQLVLKDVNLASFKGKIEYEGTLKNSCGFLQTNPYFLNKITGKEYLQLLCNARKIVEPNIKAKNIFELPLNKYAETYSTGMKKKLALTGILLQKNKVFILDEPFNGVDLQSNILIQAIIKKLKDSNKIVLIASHILAALHPVCDVLHLLKDGQINQTVSPQDFEKIEQQMTDGFLERKLVKLDRLM